MRPPRLLITAGPTQEPLDEVRFISNRSSGRLGIEVALESIRRGWPTLLLLGPVGSLDPTATEALRGHIERFRTADDLHRTLLAHWPDHDALVMAAAVADWRPAAPQPGKMRRTGADPLTVTFEPVPDLVADLASVTRPDQTVIAFALEPAESLRASAVAKMRRKRARAIVANPLETMDAEQIEPILILDDGTERSPEPPRISKATFAAWLLDQIASIRGV